MTAALPAARPRLAMRGRRERLIQTLWFEALGLAVVSPLFAVATGVSTGDSLVVLIVLSIVMMGWSALYNTAFDRVEFHFAGRVASDRPRGLRVVHAIASEASAVLVTCPLIVALTSLGWLEALLAEIGLTLAYAVYGYCFHLGFDRLSPVRTAPAHGQVLLGPAPRFDANRGCRVEGHQPLQPRQLESQPWQRKSPITTSSTAP